MFKIILGLIVAVLLFGDVPLSESKTALAQLPEVPGPPSIQINQSYAFRHLLELNDALFIAAYIIEDDSGAPATWNAFLPTAAIAKIINPAGIVISQKSLDRLGGGVFGFYFDATTFAANFTFGTDVVLRIDSNPTTFANSVTTVNQGLLCGNPTVVCASERVGTASNDDWISTSTISQTQSQLEDRLVDMAESIEREYQDDTPEVDLVEAGRINATGANVFIEAFSGIIQVAPNAFVVGHEILSNLGTPVPFAFQIELDAVSSRPRTAILDLADQFSISRTMTSLAIVFALTIPLYMGLREASKSDALALSSIGGMLVWWTSLAFIPAAVVFTVGLMLWGMLGIWIWRSIPTS